MLDVEIERAVGVELQIITITDRETIERVGDLESLGVVHRERPERINRRKLCSNFKKK